MLPETWTHSQQGPLRTTKTLSEVRPHLLPGARGARRGQNRGQGGVPQEQEGVGFFPKSATQQQSEWKRNRR